MCCCQTSQLMSEWCVLSEWESTGAMLCLWCENAMRLGYTYTEARRGGSHRYWLLANCNVNVCPSPPVVLSAAVEGCSPSPSHTHAPCTYLHVLVCLLTKQIAPRGTWTWTWTWTMDFGGETDGDELGKKRWKQFGSETMRTEPWAEGSSDSWGAMQVHDAPQS